MTLLIGFLTFILVLNCLLLILLVLVQLPKKEAGAGLAFGGGAVDTLIGAGSGNALTKLTKYAGSAFLGLAILLAVLNAQRSQSSSRSLEQELSRKSSAAPMFAVPPAQPAPSTGALSNTAAPAATPVPTNGLQVLPPAAVAPAQTGAAPAVAAPAPQ